MLLLLLRQVSGQVDQSGSMLSDDVAEKGYALLCMAVPQTDCKIMTVSEVGLLAAAWHSACLHCVWGCGLIDRCSSLLRILYTVHSMQSTA